MPVPTAFPGDPPASTAPGVLHVSRPLYLAQRLRQIEVAAAGLPLMQRAGEAAANLIQRLCPAREAPLLLLAGPGNNGGDAFVAARLLHQQGRRVTLVYYGDPARQPSDASAARQAFAASGALLASEIPDDLRYGLVVDALFGIGLQRELDGPWPELLGRIQQRAAHDRCPLLALDIPSGLDADSGTARGAVLQVNHTLSFIAAKPGFYTNDGPDYCGEIHHAPLGLKPETLVAADGSLYGLDPLKPLLQPRRRNSHKGSHGTCAVLGGSPGMTGAALLAGRAALQVGCGRVHVGLLDRHTAFDPCCPELMLRPAASLLTPALLSQCTAVAIGPGLGQGPAAKHLLAQALRLPCPLLLDADALNLLAAHPELRRQTSTRAAPTLLTPHPAEAARLLGSAWPAYATPAGVQRDRIACAVLLAHHFQAHVVLKGCGSIVAAPDGCWSINPSGNPGMASAGMGDVLTGLALALLAQGHPADAALRLAVLLHGAAADSCVAAGQGPAGLTASETLVAARRLLNLWTQTLAERH